MKTERRTTLTHKLHVLESAISLSEACGYKNITRLSVATRAGVSPGLVSNYFGTMHQLERSIMRAAVNRGILSIIAQGLTLKDKEALKAPEDLKQKALQAVSTQN